MPVLLLLPLGIHIENSQEETGFRSFGGWGGLICWGMGGLFFSSNLKLVVFFKESESRQKDPR